MEEGKRGWRVEGDGEATTTGGVGESVAADNDRRTSSKETGTSIRSGMRGGGNGGTGAKGEGKRGGAVETGEGV